MNERPGPVTQEEMTDAQKVMRLLQVQIHLPAELIERAIRTIIRDELEQQAHWAGYDRPRPPRDWENN